MYRIFQNSCYINIVFAAHRFPFLPVIVVETLEIAEPLPAIVLWLSLPIAIPHIAIEALRVLSAPLAAKGKIAAYGLLVTPTKAFVLSPCKYITLYVHTFLS